MVVSSRPLLGDRLDSAELYRKRGIGKESESGQDEGTKGGLMITEIGIVAGEIWHYLDDHGEALFSGVAKGIERPKELTLMSLGWLAREGHVIVRQEGSDFRVTLRETS